MLDVNEHTGSIQVYRAASKIRRAITSLPHDPMPSPPSTHLKILQLYYHQFVTLSLARARYMNTSPVYPSYPILSFLSVCKQYGWGHNTQANTTQHVNVKKASVKEGMNEGGGYKNVKRKQHHCHAIFARSLDLSSCD